MLWDISGRPGVTTKVVAAVRWRVVDTMAFRLGLIATCKWMSRYIHDLMIMTATRILGLANWICTFFSLTFRLTGVFVACLPVLGKIELHPLRNGFPPTWVVTSAAGASPSATSLHLPADAENHTH